MVTQPSVTAADLLVALKRSGELLTTLVDDLEPSLERAAAVSAGQLSLIDSDAPARQREVAERTAAWAREVLEPLERLLGVAAAPPYLVAQDDIQKRIIRDLREEVSRLRDQVSVLKTVALDGQARSLN